ncbi:NAD-dependent epimerase/dehydratase family protein [Bergeyella sp. RCAD1439]|uniref:NAD-dependent epimerase/dehydratase family protein n=1 Tax=Bergeyella anatis TaxID=3113737 RepID=UPI002E18BB8B|nr:NAD-dependent epimerase/dehydratase family protein [Bergeyella sp. RCAD1439]
MKTILITGGAGFIGSRLALALEAEGYGVTVLDNLLPQVHGECPEVSSPLYRSIRDRVRFIHGDVTQQADWLKALEGQEAVVHLAAATGTGQSMYKISAYNEVNVGGTAHLLDCLVNGSHQVKKIIVASSRAVYGEGKYHHPKLGVVYPRSRVVEAMGRGEFELFHEDGQLLQPMATDEEAGLHPTSVYGITKLAQEQMVHTVAQALGIASIAFRFQNVYGEGQSLLNPYTGILSVFSNQILSGKSVNVFEDGRESRDFIHIDDAVRALKKGLENGTLKNEILNVGTGVPVTVLSVAEHLRANYGKSVDIQVSGQFRLGDIRHNFADMTKTRRLLDFEAQTDFSEGMQKFTAWVLGQSIGENRLEASLAEMASRKLFF